MLRHWFPLDKIKWSSLSNNHCPHAIHLLSLPENYDKINWEKISANPFATEMLLKNPEKIDWTRLSLNTNPKAVHLLLQAFKQGNIHKICWFNVCKNNCPDIFPLLEHVIQNVHLLEDYDNDLYYLCCNPVATPLFLLPEHYHKIFWTAMCLNPSQEAITLLSLPENYNNIKRHTIALNPSAINLLQKEVDKSPERIEWSSLALNPSPEAMKLFEEHPHKINWYLITGNNSREAFELVNKNIDKIVCWSMLSCNSHALELMYEMSKGNTSRYLWGLLSSNPDIFTEWTKVEERPYKWELLAEALNPRRVSAIYQKMGSLDGYI